MVQAYRGLRSDVPTLYSTPLSVPKRGRAASYGTRKPVNGPHKYPETSPDVVVCTGLRAEMGRSGCTCLPSCPGTPGVLRSHESYLFVNKDLCPVETYLVPTGVVFLPRCRSGKDGCPRSEREDTSRRSGSGH